MPTTQDVLNAAAQVGRLLTQHETTKRLEAAIRRLQNDHDAQRLLTDFNRLLQTLSQKEAAGQPIAVAEKRQLQELQTQLAHNLVLREFQAAQMNYLDLLRKIDQQITGTQPASAPATPPAPGPVSPPAGPFPRITPPL